MIVLILLNVLIQGGTGACRGAQAADGRDKAKGRRGIHMLMKSIIMKSV